MAMSAATTLNYKIFKKNDQQTRVGMTTIDIMNEALTACMSLHVSFNLSIGIKEKC